MVTEEGPGLTLTITGVNFTKKSLVYWGARALNTRLVSETELRATIGADLVARIGIFPVTVRNPGPFLSQPQWGSTSKMAYFLVNFR